MSKAHAPEAQPIDAIVIGASAGGVRALSEVLATLPEGFNAIIMGVLHIPRERPSLLVPVLQRQCRLPVVEVEDKMPLRRGHVYVAPPDYHLLVDGGPIASLSGDELVNFSRPSIDVLFESAADIFGARLAGIVLSGANADGAEGLAAIHRSGGVALVQDPLQAEATAMPESAKRRVPAAIVLSTTDLGGWLLPRVAPRDAG